MAKVRPQESVTVNEVGAWDESVRSYLGRSVRYALTKGKPKSRSEAEFWLNRQKSAEAVVAPPARVK